MSPPADVRVVAAPRAFRLTGQDEVPLDVGLYVETVSVARRPDGTPLEAFLTVSLRGSELADLAAHQAFHLRPDLGLDHDLDLAGLQAPGVEARLRLWLAQTVLASLGPAGTSAEALAAALASAPPGDASRSVDNWYCTSVRILDEHGGSSFETPWAAFTPSALAGHLPSDGRISSVARSWFAEHGWVFETERTVLGSRILLEVQPGADLDVEPDVERGAPAWRCVALAHDLTDEFLFYSVCPQAVPVERRPSVAEHLVRLNARLTTTAFEMDWSDGEIRCRSGVDVAGDRLSPALVDRVVSANLRSVARSLPELLRWVGSPDA